MTVFQSLLQQAIEQMEARSQEVSHLAELGPPWKHVRDYRTIKFGWGQRSGKVSALNNMVGPFDCVIGDWAEDYDLKAYKGSARYFRWPQFDLKVDTAHPTLWVWDDIMMTLRSQESLFVLYDSFISNPQQRVIILS